MIGSFLAKAAAGAVFDQGVSAIASSLTHREEKETPVEDLESEYHEKREAPTEDPEAKYFEGSPDSSHNQRNPFSYVDESGMQRVDYKEMLDHLDKRDQKNMDRDKRYAASIRLGNALGGNADYQQYWGGYASPST